VINISKIWLRFSPIVSPMFIYPLVWIISIVLTGVRITSNLPLMNLSTLFLIGGNLFVLFLLYLIIFSSSKKTHPGKISIDLLELDILAGFADKLFKVWAVGTLIEIFLGGGFPLIWVILGIPKGYTEFGIPTFHGLMNGLFFFFITTFALDYFIHGGKKRLFKFIPFLLWPVMMLGRGIFLGAMLQIGAIYLICKPLSLSRIILILVAVFGMILSFGLIGDTRQTGNPFAYLVNPEYRSLMEILPSGFLWVYVYVTSPMGNLIANIETVRPSYFPVQTLGALLPSILRDKFQSGAEDPIELIDDNLNVSTLYANFLADYGVIGALVMVAIIHLVIMIIYLRVREGKASAMVAYSALYQCMIFSVFVNLFLLQTYIIQVILSIYCTNLTKKIRNEPKSF
jgi:oligosaccharide repeat unit polymerase